MMNYKLVANAPDNGKFYDILETTTDQIVAEGICKEEAKSLARHCNMGGFFDGWTPSFFLQSIPRCTF